MKNLKIRTKSSNLPLGYAPSDLKNYNYFLNDNFETPIFKTFAISNQDYV